MPLLGCAVEGSNSTTLYAIDDGEMEVSLRLLLPCHRSTPASSTSLSSSESLLGITIGRFTSSEGPDLAVVLGYTPLAKRATVEQIRVYDLIRRVNGLDVNYKNIDTILSAVTLPQQLRLGLQRMVPDAEQTLLARKGALDGQKLVTRISSGSLPASAGSERVGQKERPLEGTSYTVLYLTMGSSESVAELREDILYHFPDREGALISARGIFLTLCNVMEDIGKFSAHTCSLEWKGKKINVGMRKNGKDLLVIAFPEEKVDESQTECIMDDVEQTLSYCYGSMEIAFATDENKPRLDLFFILLGQRLKLSSDPDDLLSSCHLLQQSFHDSCRGVLHLPLPEEVKLMVSCILSTYESADFGDMADSYYGLKRRFRIFGTALYYKGYVVESHLPISDLRDITLYTTYQHVLDASREQAISRVVIWKEVYPSRCRHAYSRRTRFHGYRGEEIGYAEPDSRWFLMIIGMTHCLLAVLLESNSWDPSLISYEPADPFYVEQAQQTLLQLHMDELTTSYEWSLQSLQRVNDADLKLDLRATVKDGRRSSKHLLSAPTVNLPRITQSEEGIDNLSFEDSPPNSPLPHKRGHPSTTSSGSSDSINLYNGYGSKRQMASPERDSIGGSRLNLDQLSMNYSSISRSSSIQSSMSSRVGTGGVTPRASPFHFLSVCGHAAGVVSTLREAPSTLLIAALSKAGLTIKSQLETGEVTEAGTLIHIQHSGKGGRKDTQKAIPPYWVIGTKTKSSQIFFICYEEGVPESIIECLYKATVGCVCL